MNVVLLSSYELITAAGVGIRRQVAAMARGLPDRHGYDGDGWAEHIEGACGEMAVAKLLGVYWPGSVNTFKAGGDVALLQVRTRSRHDYDLLVRPADKDLEAIYVHVTGRAPEFRVWGWMRCGDCRRDAWWRTHGDRPGAWFVPAAALQDIAFIPTLAFMPASPVSSNGADPASPPHHPGPADGPGAG